MLLAADAARTRWVTSRHLEARSWRELTGARVLANSAVENGKAGERGETVGGREGEGAAFAADVWHFGKEHKWRLSLPSHFFNPDVSILSGLPFYKLIDSRNPDANANCNTLAAVRSVVSFKCQLSVTV